MSLNLIENSDVMRHIETIEDERIKGLLARMHTEYSAYVRAGSIEEFEYYKKLSTTTMEDWWRLTNNITAYYKTEVECLNQYIESIENGKTETKRGRKKKSE